MFPEVVLAAKKNSFSGREESREATSGEEGKVCTCEKQKEGRERKKEKRGRGGGTGGWEKDGVILQSMFTTVS